ncbi:MAG: ABC transporter ATP-binding protein [Bacteroidales bacterium]|nr:ABC transporter ATP-binding protein [Bacteroidales bacterium]MCF8338010.1 ABC transporter ATP-binding protein [Bacteroidales bacterium]
MEIPVLKIADLSKSYGALKAVDNLSIEVQKGQVFGILGPNGSGKTTTLAILLDVVHADKGKFEWFGQEVDAQQRQKIGAILEEPIFYPYLSGLDNLQLTAQIKNTGYEKIPEVLNLVELYERRNDKFRTYSYGMRQRLAIAGALLGDPEVLILDEPTNGLDPQGIAEIRRLINKIASRGITIILASHLLDEVQKVCTHVAILQKGKKLASGSVEDVLQETKRVELAAQDMKHLKNGLEEMKEITNVREENHLLVASISGELSSETLNKMLFEKGITLSHLAVRKKSLESYFLDVLNQNENKNRN